jgi:outer membrane murein-binding lipoprotein Lpp
MHGRLNTIALTTIATLTLLGCASSDEVRNSKREADRASIQLTQTQTERDQLRREVDDLRRQLATRDADNQRLQSALTAEQQRNSGTPAPAR